VLLLSSTSLQAFKRCRKSYQLGYIKGLTPTESRGVIQFGIDFHKYAEIDAKMVAGIPLEDGYAEKWLERHDDPMGRVYDAYRCEFGLPAKEQILGVERAVWFRVVGNVLLRMTYDLIYEDEHGWIVDRDYKTFSKMPTIDVDLDFQGRLFMAGLAAMFPGRKIRREYHNVRQELGRELKGKGYVEWTREERYHIVPLVVSRAQLETTRREAIFVAHEIADSADRFDGPFYRTELKGDMPHACGQCFVKEACKKDLAGQLDEQTIDLLYDVRKPFEAPDMAQVIDLTKDLTA